MDEEASSAPSAVTDKKSHAFPRRELGCRQDHLEANAAALDIALTDEDQATLDAACPPGATQGTRYPAGAMKAVHF